MNEFDDNDDIFSWHSDESETTEDYDDGERWWDEGPTDDELADAEEEERKFNANR